LKIASVGWNTPLDVEEPNPSVQPATFALSAFPNPFNSELHLNYELPSARNVDLLVFNVLGQKVTTLFRGRAVAGSHNLTWTPQVSGGLYFVSLKTGADTQIRKVLYLK
jgi:hypothetical protein